MPGPKEDAFLEGSSRRADFTDLQEMNGATCGAKQAKILTGYDSWSRTPPLGPSASFGRHVDGLARFRQAAVLQGVGVSG